MNCRQAQRQIFATRDGVIAETDRRALAEHLAGCAVCQQVDAGFTAAIQAWRADSSQVRVPDPQREWQRLSHTMARGERSPARRHLTGWLALPLAAAAAVAVGVFVTPNEPDREGGSRGTAVAGKAEAAAIDSTVVYVDEKSGWTFVWTTDSSKSHI